MARKYPTVHWSKCKLWNRPFANITGCSGCCRSFTKHEVIHVKETRVTYMRGDDEIEFYCDSCVKKANQKDSADNKEWTAKQLARHLKKTGDEIAVD